MLQVCKQVLRGLVRLELIVARNISAYLEIIVATI